jgi:fluoride exporter
MSAKLLLSIAAGGALGAVGRFVLMSHVGRWLGDSFPYATLSVNVLGAFVLGMLVEIMALAWSPGEAVRAFLVVGLLGGFTTFSLFSMDMANLISRGANMQASLYMGASVMLCVAGFYAGLAVFRQILA